MAGRYLGYAGGDDISECRSCTVGQSSISGARECVGAETYDCSAGEDRSGTVNFLHASMETDAARSGVAVRFYAQDGCGEPV